MKLLWCWRCRQELPMLDEVEFAEVWQFMSPIPPAPGTGSRVADRFAAALQAYERLTGMAETNPNAVLHHRLSLYGPPCVACGKPLRTPRARHCAACGTVG